MKPFIIIIYCTLSLFLASAKTAMAAPYALRPDTSGTCYSAVQDTGVNPYSLGIAGNWRPYRSFTYYGARKESDASVTTTDIRKNGTFATFVPFWNRQSSDSILKPVYDTTIWVWNAQSTLFNIKGFELENKDPLGRYNAGLYGYDNTLPVAVIQNAHYRESLFEGFEDYDFGGNKDTTCAVTRNFDYTPYKSSIDSNVAHSGTHSILVKSAVGAGSIVVNTDTDDFDFTINTSTTSCYPGAILLKGIRADGKVILPSFSPFAGKKMLVSVWVKEVLDCNCSSYTKSNISIKTG
ncbi:hypothetical protein, partial [Chitinophaga sp.]|uniref:hypothetical protein n=1 Tax=Chitinophaga sp. TaxID=1869181 RepID=UPI002F93D4ED